MEFKNFQTLSQQNMLIVEPSLNIFFVIIASIGEKWKPASYPGVYSIVLHVLFACPGTMPSCQLP